MYYTTKTNQIPPKRYMRGLVEYGYVVPKKMFNLYKNSRGDVVFKNPLTKRYERIKYSWRYHKWIRK